MKNQEPTTTLSKAKRWFKQNNICFELERGVPYIKLNDEVDVQITSQEIIYRAMLYDKGRGIELPIENYDKTKLHT